MACQRYPSALVQLLASSCASSKQEKYSHKPAMAASASALAGKRREAWLALRKLCASLLEPTGLEEGPQVSGINLFPSPSKASTRATSGPYLAGSNSMKQDTLLL